MEILLGCAAFLLVFMAIAFFVNAHGPYPAFNSKAPVAIVAIGAIVCMLLIPVLYKYIPITVEETRWITSRLDWQGITFDRPVMVTMTEKGKWGLILSQTVEFFVEVPK